MVESTEEYEHYRSLSPDDILHAVEIVGPTCDGRLLALNSYENRVYQVGIEGQAPLVAKFYRPGRWSDEQIREEHEFTLELLAYELPVVAPLRDAQGETLHHHGPFRFTLYPRYGGRAPQLDQPQHLEQLGRLLARVHGVGATASFRCRPVLDLSRNLATAYETVLERAALPPDLQAAYRAIAEELLDCVRQSVADAGRVQMLRLHGDCHPGNILASDTTFHLLDFDDSCTGPAIQDIWMFLSGDRDYMTARLEDFLEGYSEFREFDARELRLIEPLRTVRMMTYAAWIATRWSDPAFPQAFPWFGTPRYWGEHVLALREQRAALDEPPIERV